MKLSPLVLSLSILAPGLFASDWTMFGGNPQRTGFAKDETKISSENAESMKLEWSAKLENQSKELNSLTVPLTIINLPTDKGFRDIVIIAGSADTVFGLNADNGKIMWKKTMSIEGAPKNPKGHWLCPNALNATPLIDRQSTTVYVLASDGKLHGFTVI